MVVCILLPSMDAHSSLYELTLKFLLLEVECSPHPTVSGCATACASARGMGQTWWCASSGSRPQGHHWLFLVPLALQPSLWERHAVVSLPSQGGWITRSELESRCSVKPRTNTSSLDRLIPRQPAYKRVRMYNCCFKSLTVGRHSDWLCQ